MPEKLKNELTDEELENVIGGVGNLPTFNWYKYCTTCNKNVIPTVNANGKYCCPDCGMLFNGEFNCVN